MHDPLLSGEHLDPDRRPRFETAVQRLKEALARPAADVPFQVNEAGVLLPPSEPAPAGGPYVLLVPGPQSLYTLRIGLNTIGRSRDNDITLNRPPVSRRHCVILVHPDGECELHDTASLNGTLVNGRPVVCSPLTSGDVITITDCRCVLRRLTDAATAATHLDAEDEESWASPGDRVTLD